MRIATIFILILCCCAGAAGSSGFQANSAQVHVQLVSSSPAQVQMNYQLEKIKPTALVASGVAYTTFELDGEGALMRKGLPLLPAITRNVVIDPQANVELVITEEESPTVISNLDPPFRVEEPELEESYRGDTLGLYPPQVAEMSEPFVVRGVRMVAVTVYPVQYDFATGNYIEHSQVSTEVRVTGGRGVNAVDHPVRKNRSPEFMKMIQDFAVNGHEVGRDDPDRDALPPNNGHYLVVVNETLLRYVVPFIEWRRKAGYKVDIYSVRNQDVANDNTIREEINRRYQAYIHDGQDPFGYILLVGDRGSYLEMQNQAAVLEAPQGANTFGARHADYLYACVEGNDERPDIAFGRWPGGNAGLVGLMVGRTLAYEATPDMQDTSWFTRGGAVSQHWGNGAEAAYHVTNPEIVRWGEELLQARGFREVRVHEVMDWDQYGSHTGPVFQDLLNDGANMVLARSENYYWCTRNPAHNSFDNDIEVNTKFPIRFNASGHGEWSAEMEYRTGDAQHLKGWVNLTNSWNGPVTGVSNAIWVDQVHGVMQMDLPMGWGYAYAIAHFETHLPQFGDGNLQIGRTDHNHFGDPGLKVWIGVPKVYEMEVPETISPATRYVETVVHGAGGGDPIANAKVTFYAPGRMPAADNAAYATYGGYWYFNTTTDENGIARLVVDETDTLVANTNLYVTVTGDDVVPCFGVIGIRTQNTPIEIGSYTFTEAQGNNDGDPNPGERFELNITASNLGADNVQGVTAVVSSSSPYIEIENDNGIEFGDIAGHGTAEGNRVVSILLSPSCPDGAARPLLKPVVMVDFASQDQTWRSAITLDPHSPHLEFRSVVGGNVIPDSNTTINVEVANVGRISSGGIGVELRSKGQGVTVIGGQSSFPAIAPDRTARLNGGNFELSGNKVVVPGSTSKVYMIFTTDMGFVDTSYFELQIGTPRAGVPIGPDPYGYICFDNTDTAWDIAPVYEWEEINPAADGAEFEGTRLGFRGQSPRDIGEAIVIPLGFSTTFYGRSYDTITVASNGFIAVGNQPRISMHHNWPMDEAIGGGAGMIAPFWDDLKFNANNSGVYVYHDEDSSRFIVEWYRLKHNAAESELTFQVILYDQSEHHTVTGDQNIEFRYKSISNNQNIRNGDQAWVSNNPFASVGISSPDGKSGISYSWNNTYPPGAAPLANRRALLFSTAPKFKACKLYGHVYDAADGAPIEGATVYTLHGFVSTTDAEGYWEIAEALADVAFQITARIESYNDSTYDSLVVPENDSLEITFGLLHGEFTPSTLSIFRQQDADLITDVAFSLTNTGNGPLSWRAEKKLYGDANASPWQMRRTYFVGDTLDDDRLEGVVFAENNFYISGANGPDSSMIYVLDRAGNLVRQFEQPCHSRYGMKDLEWDGSLLWGSGDSMLYGMSLDGELVTSFDVGLNPCNNIAYDSDRDLYWVSGTTTNFIKGFNRLGVVVDSLARKSLRMYGLSYWPEDPDGQKLYLTTYAGNDVPTRVYKMDTETGDTTMVQELRLPAGATALGGGYITNQYDIYSWVYMTMPNVPIGGGGDQVYIYQLDARKDWMNLDQWQGVLQTGETQDLRLTFNSTSLPDTLFQGEMFFRHNADSGLAHLEVSLRVIGEMISSPFNLLLPENGDTLIAFPQHGDTVTFPQETFVWSSSIDPNHDDTLITYLAHFWLGDQVVSYLVNDTFLVVNIDTLGLPLSPENPLNWWVQAISGSDTVSCVAPFELKIMPDSYSNGGLTPVEFGLKSVYPSPFNSVTTLRFGADKQLRTTLSAYDILGRKVAVLFDKTPQVGYYSVVWDAGNLASGVYVLRLESAGKTSLMKVALVR